MTDDKLPLAELMRKAGGEDFLRSVAEAVVQLLMKTDVDGLIGARRHERSGERTTYRNGYRDRTLDTRLGSLQLRYPQAGARSEAAAPEANVRRLIMVAPPSFFWREPAATSPVTGFILGLPPQRQNGRRQTSPARGRCERLA